jgi:hypothetical protein
MQNRVHSGSHGEYIPHLLMREADDLSADIVVVGHILTQPPEDLGERLQMPTPPPSKIN